MKTTDLAVCRETQEALPWYANGSLEAGEKRRVEKHLATCTVCARELRVVETMQERLAPPRSDAEAAPFGQLLHRINRHETRTRQWKIAAAVAAMLAIVLAVTLPVRMFAPEYRSVSDPVAETARIQLAVTLRDPADTRELVALLEHYHADVVSASDNNPFVLEFRLPEGRSVAELEAALRSEPQVAGVERVRD